MEALRIWECRAFTSSIPKHRKATSREHSKVERNNTEEPEGLDFKMRVYLKGQGT